MLSSACVRQHRQARLGRRAALGTRVPSQLVGRPVTDSRHRAVETQATNLHPPFFFFPSCQLASLSDLPQSPDNLGVCLASRHPEFIFFQVLADTHNTWGRGRGGGGPSSLCLCKADSSIQSLCRDGAGFPLKCCPGTRAASVLVP